MSIRSLNLAVLITLVAVGFAFVVAGYSHHPPEFFRNALILSRR